MANSSAQATALKLPPNSIKEMDGDGVKAENTEETSETLTNGESTESTANEQTLPKGSLSTSKILYAGPEDSKGRYTWQDSLPEHVKAPAENKETAQHAVIVRKKQAFDSRRSLDVHSIIVQSPWLKKALGKILEGYPGITCELDRLVFYDPFECFVHRWSSLVEFKDNLIQDLQKEEPKRTSGLHDSMSKDDMEKTKEHLVLLYDILQQELNDTIKALADFLAQGVCTYEHLWAMFQPGDTIISSHSGMLSAYEMLSGEYIETQCGDAYRLKLDCVVWDGRKFGRHEERALLYEFKGTRDVASLDAFPLSFHPEKNELRETLVKRGKKAEKLAGYHYQTYDGIAVTWNNEGKSERVTISGRVIVDANAFNRFKFFWFPFVHSKGLKDKDHVTVSEKPWKGANKLSKNGVTIVPTSDRSVELSKDLLLITSPLVYGYSLKSKQWMAFFVDVLTPIKWNNAAFSSLVLPVDQKDLIMSIAESQTQEKQEFDDVIAGKGKGIILLLSGPPGVGKTLTAESVAEQMRSPLYTLSAGDLGVEPNQVESKLSKVMEMVQKWNAVLLLDECDVFLEERSTHDLERNKLVSIFLRTLEYYEGILFLTTNRRGNIDAAFQSRIHVSMAYPELSAESRKKVWENFLSQGTRHAISAADMDELSKEKLNGRQIKNVLKTAQLLVKKRGGLLRKETVDTILAIERGRN